jgi:hypothetical protein
MDLQMEVHKIINILYQPRTSDWVVSQKGIQVNDAKLELKVVRVSEKEI